MIPNLSALDTASAMARHAGHVHGTVSSNIARADMPGATAQAASAFGDALGALHRGEPLRVMSTDDPIVLDYQMTTMAQNAGRHDAAVSVWSKVLGMVRLAGSSPR